MRRQAGAVKVNGLRVEVNGNFDKALRTFSKKVQESGLLRELREREHYEKPTTKRKKAKQIAKKREQKRHADESIHSNRKY